MASSTLKDPKVTQTLKRHFVVVTISGSNADRAPEIDQLIAKIGKNTYPLIVYANDRADYLIGTSNRRSEVQMKEDLANALQKMPQATKAAEAELGKQSKALEQALDDKKYKEAGKTFDAILRVKGYSALKDTAYDVMETGQKEATSKVAEAVKYAEEDDFVEASKTLNEVAKDYAGLPVATAVKDNLAALKLLQAAAETVKDKKGATWKARALQNLNEVRTKYASSAFAGLAVKRKAELEAMK